MLLCAGSSQGSGPLARIAAVLNGSERLTERSFKLWAAVQRLFCLVPSVLQAASCLRLFVVTSRSEQAEPGIVFPSDAIDAT